VRNDVPALPPLGHSPEPGVDPLLITTILRPSGATGVHTHIRQLWAHAEADGHETQLVTPFSRSRAMTTAAFAPKTALDLVSTSAAAWWYHRSHEVVLRRALRGQLSRLDRCIVYAQCPWSARAALAARTGPDQRVVVGVHFRTSLADEWVNKGKIHRDGRVFEALHSAERQVLPAVDGLVFVSRWGRDALLAWLPEAADVPSAVIPNFLTPSQAQPQPASTDLVTVGSLEPVKNHEYLLRVLAAARDRGRTYTLDVFGRGPLHDELTRLARSLGVADQVRLRGFVPDVRARLGGSRAYVHASWSESLPLAIVEALAARLPVVAGDSGGIREIVDDGVEGRIWPLDDPARAADVLIDLLEQGDAHGRASRAALARFERDFDAAVVAPRLLAFLRGEGPPLPMPTPAAPEARITEARAERMVEQ
jgi:glycosyltransferase involved in cell wall biosynthesis